MKFRSHFAAASRQRPFARVLVLSVAAVSVLACSDRLSTAAPPVLTTSPTQPMAGTLPVDSGAASLPPLKPAPQAGKHPQVDETPEPTPMV